MPQELQVLQCFNCETFQVNIVKKVPKWSCKICGEKQSVKKIYGKGTGKECREFVQNLNEQRLMKHNFKPEIVDFAVAEAPQVPSICEERKSKWAEFTENAVEEKKMEKTVDNVFEDKETDLDAILDL